MKHNLVTAALLASSLVFSGITYADESTQSTELMKQWSVGGGTSAVVLNWDETEDDDFGGLALSATYAFNDNFAIRGTAYSLEHDDYSDAELTGFELSAYYGTGLASKGFRAYIGGGIYSETLEFNDVDFDEDFSGAQISGGFGYNWDSVSLDLIVSLRSTGDYEDLADDGEDVAAASSSLVLAYRF